MIVFHLMYILNYTDKYFQNKKETEWVPVLILFIVGSMILLFGIGLVRHDNALGWFWIFVSTFALNYPLYLIIDFLIKII